MNNALTNDLLDMSKLSDEDQALLQHFDREFLFLSMICKKRMKLFLND